MTTAERTLSDTDRQAAVWLKLKKHMQDRLAVLRQQNDGDRDFDETQKLRGRIAELKRLLDLDADMPVIED